MDTKVVGSIVLKRESGNLPAAMVTFYSDEKPAVTALEGKRVAFLRYKTDKKSGTRRENMAVQVSKIDVDTMVSKSQHEFLQSLFDAYQDQILSVVADSSAVEGLKMETAEDLDKMVADFNDKSRDANGRKVTAKSITEWFMENCAAYITTRALEKNAQMTEDTLAKLLADYAAMFCKLTKYDLGNIYPANQLELVQRILANCHEDSSEMREWINGKVRKIADAMKGIENLIDAI